MQTGGDGVRFRGKTGSHGWRGKPTRLTRNGHWPLVARQVRSALVLLLIIGSSGYGALNWLGTPMRFWQIAPLFRSFCGRTFHAALTMALLLAVLGQSQAADPAPKRVLMLHSFGPRFKPWSDYEQYIRSEISRRWQKPVDFLDQSLVNTRLEDENAEAIFADYLRALYTSRPVDLIVAIGAPAAAFVQRYRRAPVSSDANGLHGGRSSAGSNTRS